MFYKKIESKRLKNFLPVFCLPLIIDQLTKFYALQVLEQQSPIDILGGLIRLSLIFNPNGFLGILTHSSATVKVIVLYFTVVVLVAVGIFFILVSRKISSKQQFFLTLVLSGGTSNFLDRIIHDQGVVDFLQFSLGPLQSGVCNPADLFIFIGGAALGYLAFYKI